ncbi:MAG: hypothetical protein Kow00105_07990 [Phycisphaeraceae bacterium]
MPRMSPTPPFSPVILCLGLATGSALADPPTDEAQAPPPTANKPTIEINLGHALDALTGEPVEVAPPPGQSIQQLRERYRQLTRERQELDQTIWSEERLAQEYEETFVKLWDDLRLNSHKPDDFIAFEFSSITIGRPGERQLLVEGVSRAPLNSKPTTLDHAGWQTLVDDLFAAGYRAVQSEWHHASFGKDEQGRRVSTFNITIDLTHPESDRRLTVTGPIRIVWSKGTNRHGHHLPDSIDATGLTLLERQGTPLFESVELGKVRFAVGQDDVLAYDLDQDGLIDVIYPNQNVVFRNRGNGEFSRDTLCEYPIRIIAEAALADLTGDGRVDYLVAGSNLATGQTPKRYGLFLFEGDGEGGFTKPAKIAIPPNELPLKLPSSFALGDIDRDGDLDVYIAQYKPAYSGGNFPSPYYDANDGHPGYLLVNRGDGTFVDATAGSGLEAKRFRRAFRASFADLDDDNDLDLLVVSDFAGADLYYNDGQGRFEDVTASAMDIPTNFGMGHTFDDFDGDGELDFYVTGMASTTARRLSKMGLKHPELEAYNDQRLIVAYGNRMYLSRSGGRFVEPEFRDQVARSGWSWGGASADVNNDGYPDIYIANGNKSGVSAKDYCTRFWCHDIYSNDSKEDPARFKLFTDELGKFSDAGLSWNGFEHNHLFLSLSGQGFFNAGFLMGVALEQDSRAVLAHDFDNDGRVDLLVSTRNSLTEPEYYRLHLLRNRGDVGGRHWVGVRLRGVPGVSPIGAKVRVHTPDGVRTNAVVSGDSYSAQHAPALHFGLGKTNQIDRIEVTWPDGRSTTLAQPAIDAYHVIMRE